MHLCVATYTVDPTRSLHEWMCHWKQNFWRSIRYAHIYIYIYIYTIRFWIYVRICWFELAQSSFLGVLRIVIHTLAHLWQYCAKTCVYLSGSPVVPSCVLYGFWCNSVGSHYCTYIHTVYVCVRVQTYVLMYHNISPLLFLSPCFCSFFVLFSSFHLSPPTIVDDPNLAPVQPMNTPTIFFDPSSSSPWVFSLNLSSVLPANNSQLRPNSMGPSIHGFVLQMTVENNGTNITVNHFMVCIHPYVQRSWSEVGLLSWLLHNVKTFFSTSLKQAENRANVSTRILWSSM